MEYIPAVSGMSGEKPAQSAQTFLVVSLSFQTPELDHEWLKYRFYAYYEA